MSKYLEKTENQVIRMHKIPTRKVYSFGLNNIWSVDLSVYRKNETVKGTNQGKGNLTYILNCVDIFSRKLYSEKLEDRTSISIIDGFNRIFKQSGKKPEHIVSDKEFLNKPIKDYFTSNNI